MPLCFSRRTASAWGALKAPADEQHDITAARDNIAALLLCTPGGCSEPERPGQQAAHPGQGQQQQQLGDHMGPATPLGAGFGLGLGGYSPMRLDLDPLAGGGPTADAAHPADPGDAMFQRWFEATTPLLAHSPLAGPGDAAMTNSAFLATACQPSPVGGYGWQWGSSGEAGSACGGRSLHEALGVGSEWGMGGGPRVWGPRLEDGGAPGGVCSWQ